MGRQRPLLAAAMATAGVVGVYRWLVRPRLYTWGATAAEAATELPGDDMVESDAPRTTRAVTIDAPPEVVWRWLVQIGEDRAGFYSYDWLERLAGTRIHNADTIHPQWQDVHVGDTVWLGRRFGERARQVVAELQPASHLVLMSGPDFERTRRGEKAFGSWAFYLRPHHGGTRLLARGIGGPVGVTGFDIMHFVMERGMLHGIRARAAEQHRGRAPS